jgi:hypothetical protein
MSSAGLRPGAFGRENRTVDDFTSARAKLNRAAEHYQAFQTVLDAYLAAQPVSLVPRPNPEGNADDYYVSLARSLPPELNTIFGDYVHNLRAVLDHTVRALAVANGGDPNDRTTAFPICRSAAEFAEAAKRNLKPPVGAEGCSSEARELLDSGLLGRFTPLEHRRLKTGSPCTKVFERGVELRLHDEMDVGWLVRPQADVDLGGLGQGAYYAASAVQQRTHFGSLVRSQICDPFGVAQRLDKERSHSKGSDAVLNSPMLGLMDRTAWEIAPPVGEVTCDAASHVR